MTGSPPRAVVASGHRLDSPDRPHPRFPATEVDRVSAEIRDALHRWEVGPGTTLVCGGASGADILAAESALSLGARVRLCLALPPDEFDRRSVAPAGAEWTDRFRRLLGTADVAVDVLPGDHAANEVFARANQWIIDVAGSLSGAQPPHVLLIWNGDSGDGSGGTADFVRALGLAAPAERVVVIDPTPRRYEARQRASGPKRLLALDGGGIRGALSLEILAAIESQLRAARGEPGLVLADSFDYIAGTSTGAIIAAGLALGKTVAELQKAYTALGRKVFQKRFPAGQLRSRYRDGPLTEELNELLGEDRTLGDPAIRTLLLVVLHNTVTDSPWPLSNCTQAKYNRADRYLHQLPDRNLDLSLVGIVRGSTAAPLFFPPQEIGVGATPFLFQDGGITPFNNPALLLYLMATLPEYGLGWEPGADNILLVSVGTGFSAAVHPGLAARKVQALFNVMNLPSVFMNGASFGQDLACRAVGSCRAGPVLDREIGDRVGRDGVGGPGLFSYVRYDADLSAPALTARGITDPRHQRSLRKLDAVSCLPQLRDLGRAVGATVDVNEHFRGFV